MTTLEHAARQALDALENRFNPKGYGEMDNAITALRQALEQIDVKTSLINRLQEYARALKDYDLACDILGAIELLEQQPNQEPVCCSCPYIEIHDAVVKDNDKAIALLRQCFDEMRYAGWNKFVSDNTGRNAVYEQLQEFLK
jgi:hypothetical protein